jgi:tetratricopeptide (TPR) repeat protein
MAERIGCNSMRPPLLRALCLASALCAAGCDREARDGSSSETSRDGGASTTDRASSAQLPSARETEDALGAIDTLLEADRPREAEIIARKLLDRFGGDENAPPRIMLAAARTLLSRSQTQGESLKRAERGAMAREAALMAQRATRANDADVEHLRFAALAASTAGTPADALEHALRALAQEPDHVPTLFLGATVALASIDLPQATALIARHVRLAPDDPWSAGLEARLALATGDSAHAIARATDAVAHDRGALEFKLILARALTAGGRAADSVRMIAAMGVTERSRGPVAQVLSEALDASGDSAAAARAWDPALFAAPDDAAIRAEAALAFVRAGDRARAETELRVLSTLDGGRDEYARIEERLQRALEAAKSRATQ